MTNQEKVELQFLLTRPEFISFLLRVIQMADIFAITTNGSDGRNLAYAEGRRNLGLELLSEVEQAQPAPQDDSLTTILQVLLKASQIKPEKPNGRRNPDRHPRDLDGDSDTGDDADDG